MAYFIIGVSAGIGIICIFKLESHRNLVRTSIFCAALGVGLGASLLTDSDFKIQMFLIGFAMIAWGYYSTAKHLFGNDYWTK